MGEKSKRADGDISAEQIQGYESDRPRDEGKSGWLEILVPNSESLTSHSYRMGWKMVLLDLTQRERRTEQKSEQLLGRKTCTW